MSAKAGRDKGNGNMSDAVINANPAQGPLVYRQTRWTRVTHWVWAVSLFFLMMTGLQIFNAHPSLSFGNESGFEYENAVLDIGAKQSGNDVVGYTKIFGKEFDTTGYLGVSGPSLALNYQAFPAALTIPSNRSLATGRIIHFFFAWILVTTLLVWAIASIITGHLRRDLVITGTDLKNLPQDIKDHARLKFHHTKEYNTLQKLAYASVLFVAFPLMILTGLSMSPNFNAFAPWLLDIFGGRQSARTIHFLTMLFLIGFFIVHMLMILAAGPINELRSIITGWYRVDAQTGKDH
jgi:thiosulfate reductase cytochrome b subunit